MFQKSFQTIPYEGIYNQSHGKSLISETISSMVLGLSAAVDDNEYLLGCQGPNCIDAIHERISS